MEMRETKMSLRQWAKPKIRRIAGGSAELGGTNGVDGSAAFS
jgi:hypothetical protein